MRVYIDTKGILKYFNWFIGDELNDYKLIIGWIFGFYEYSGSRYAKSDTNILKLVLSPFKICLCILFAMAIITINIVSSPFVLLWNIKFSR